MHPLRRRELRVAIAADRDAARGSPSCSAIARGSIGSMPSFVSSERHDAALLREQGDEQMLRLLAAEAFCEHILLAGGERFARLFGESWLCHDDLSLLESLALSS